MQLITSYPRSGSHFLSDKINSIIGIPTLINHHPIKSDPGISCIRNPIDSISSWISMTLSASELRDPKFAKNSKSVELFISTLFTSMSKQYEAFYVFLKKSDHFFINYENLINDPDKVVYDLADKLNLKILQNPRSTKKWEDDRLSGFIVTSKKEKQYRYIYDFVTNNIDKNTLNAYLEVLEINSFKS